MYNLIFVLSVPFSFLGSYQNLESCNFAIREIFAMRMNVPGQRDPQFDKTLDLMMKNNREFLCVPVKR
jgi:hypothetical protein